MNPDFEGYEYIYAQSLHEENKTEEALRLVQKGLSKNEFDTNLLLTASQFSYELHDSKQAENYLLKAKDVAIDDEDVLMRLTNLYLEEKRYEDVVTLSRDNIDSVLTKWNIAKAYQALEADKKRSIFMMNWQQIYRIIQSSCKIMLIFYVNLGKRNVLIRLQNVICN